MQIPGQVSLRANEDKIHLQKALQIGALINIPFNKHNNFNVNIQYLDELHFEKTLISYEIIEKMWVLQVRVSIEESIRLISPSIKMLKIVELLLLWELAILFFFYFYLYSILFLYFWDCWQHIALNITHAIFN